MDHAAMLNCYYTVALYMMIMCTTDLRSEWVGGLWSFIPILFKCSCFESFDVINASCISSVTMVS